MSLFAWQVTWTDCIIIGAIDLVWSLFVIVMLLRHCRLPQGLQDVECVLCRVMSCCSQCEWQKYDWRERLWSSHSIWGQRNGERGFEPVQITVSLSLLPWLIQLISYSLSFSQLDIAFLFTHSLRLTVPWMVSRIKLASFRTQFVSTSSSELTASSSYTPPLWV